MVNDNSIEIKEENDDMTNIEVLINAIRIIAEKSNTKEEFLKELDRLTKKKPQ